VKIKIELEIDTNDLDDQKAIEEFIEAINRLKLGHE
jgi:hypothetical protein